MAATPRKPGSRRRAVALALLFPALAALASSYFLPWYTVNGSLASESLLPWAVRVAGTSQAPGTDVRSFATATLPTTGQLYSLVGMLLLSALVLGALAAAGLIGTRRGLRFRGPLAAMLLASGVLAAMAPTIVMADQPASICYDSEHANIGWSGPPPVTENGTPVALPGPTCSWIYEAPGGTWSSSGPPGPESSFWGHAPAGATEPNAPLSGWGPSVGWYLTVLGSIALLGSSIVVASDRRRPPGTAGTGARESPRVRARLRRSAGRLVSVVRGAGRDRALASGAVALGTAALVVSLLTAWYVVVQSGVTESFGPTGMGNGPWLGTSPPFGLDAAGMPYTGLLYDLAGAGIASAAALAGLGAIILGFGSGPSLASVGRKFAIGALVLSLAAPVGVALAQPTAICADFPSPGTGGNRSLPSATCYWVTAYAGGGAGPAPAYSGGPGSGFFAGSQSSGTFTWGPSIGWILPFVGAAFLAAGSLAPTGRRDPLRPPGSPAAIGRSSAAPETDPGGR